jgi:quercetin dioxygenase-like cupin family protein
MLRRLCWIAFGMTLGAAGVGLSAQGEKGTAGALKRKLLMEQVLAEKIDGRPAKVTVVELERAPGSAGAPHRHPGPVFVYVLSGELEAQVDDGPVRIYKQGEMLFEPARALHRVSRNPSPTKPVRFLAFLLTAKDEKNLVLPAKP